MSDRRAEAFADELGPMIEEGMKDPEFKAAWEAMSDRRTEAFAKLEWWSVHAPGGLLPLLGAARSTLNRHAPYIQRTSRGPERRWCLACSREPCPDEKAVIDALLGPEAPPTEGTA